MASSLVGYGNCSYLVKGETCKGFPLMAPTANIAATTTTKIDRKNVYSYLARSGDSFRGLISRALLIGEQSLKL